MKKYITTKQQCQKQIDKLNHVCSCCGGILSPIETVDNASNPTYWIGCNSCLQFNNGATERIYKIASKMVDERDFVAYKFEQRPKKGTKQFQFWRRGQIGGTVRFVADVLRYADEIK